MTDLETWERCWSEVPGGVPDYFAKGELQQLVELRAKLYEKYLGGITEVAEFGCGLGHNLIPLIGTARRLRGFDWSESAVRRVRALGIEGGVFDMLHPDDRIELSGAVLTVHALEQLGELFPPFLLFLLRKKPAICIHIEPIVELYDHTKRDMARFAYHHRRGYLSGYLTALKELESIGRAELLEVRKSPFGGKDHDAYSVVVWRPL